MTENDGVKKYRSIQIQRAVVFTLLVIGAVIFITPFVWMICTSLKPSTQVYTFPPEFIPRPVVWRNYLEVWKEAPVLSFVKNSVTVTVLTTLGTLLSSAIVAFGFARLQFPGKTVLFMILLSTMMLPPQVTMIPIYLLFSALGWINTFKPLVVPAFFGNPFYIFLLRQFFMTIPRELDDAAKIDGCSYFGLLTRIILPLSKPALAAVVIFSITWTWNDFMGPLIYLNTVDKYTMVMGLRFFQNRFAQTSMQLLMALSVMSIIPMLIMFFFTQKHFVEGITLTGMKN